MNHLSEDVNLIINSKIHLIALKIVFVCIGLYQSIEDMHKLVQIKNGDCLSDRYYNLDRKRVV